MRVETNGERITTGCTCDVLALSEVEVREVGTGGDEEGGAGGVQGRALREVQVAHRQEL